MTDGASLLDEAHRRPAPSPLISGPSPSSLLSPRSPLPAASMDRSYSNSSEASTSTANAQPVTLHLVSTFSYVASLGISAPPHIKAKTSHKVVKIKRAVYKHWPGRPRIEGIRLIYAGRVLQDEETLAMVLQPGQTEAYIHLAVRPDAWSERDKAPLTPTGPRMLAAMPPKMTKPAASPTRLRSTTVDPLEGSSYFALPSELPSTSTPASTPGLRLADLVHMEALPRVLSISYKLYHKRYTRLYESSQSAIPVDQSVTPETYGAASKQAIDEVERQVFKWRSWSDLSSTMTLPQQLKTCYDRMERIRLTLELLEGFKQQPSLAQRLSATLPSPNAGPAPLPTATIAPPQQPIAIPRPTVAEIVGMVIPVVCLALKLGLLLYIFTMHASKTKRRVMIAAATVWVAVEMVRTWRRRIRRLTSAQRRAARAQRRASGQQDRPAPSRQPTSPATPAASPALRIPVAPQRYSATSPSELQFWLQRLAFVGLDEEDLELGLRPGASQAQAWMIRVTRERLALRNRRDRRPRVSMLQNFDMTRAIYELFYPVVLYAITLIPDCEDLRRREVNKRSDLIRKWWSQTGRAWVETKRRELESDAQDGEEVASRQPVELPRLLKHPHVLRLLDLKPTADGLVAAANLAESSNERRIDIREELDAAREQARPDGAGGAGVAAAAAADEGIAELDEDDGNDEIGWAIF